MSKLMKRRERALWFLFESKEKRLFHELVIINFHRLDFIAAIKKKKVNCILFQLLSLGFLI